MTTRTLIIKQVSRGNKTLEETLKFERGVNVIVGPPNAGKSKWLDMLDYALGDTGKPEDAFSSDLAQKYDWIRVIAEINGEELILERDWKTRGRKSKIVVNDTPVPDQDFSEFWLTKLEIPRLYYPKGNPYKGDWMRLSWRSLFRHIYRQQRFWSDFADKQPASEQLACLLLFLGIADSLYSDAYGTLIKQQREMLKLEGARDEFQRLVDRIASELLDVDGISSGVTENSLSLAIKKLDSDIESLQQSRERALIELTPYVRDEADTHSDDGFDTLTERWAELQRKGDALALELQRTNARIEELRRFEGSLRGELDKLGRAQAAATLLSPLRATHCPVCDQAIQVNVHETSTCYLCKQSTTGIVDSLESGAIRLKFETDHLQDELREVTDLIKELHVTRENILSQQRLTQEEFHRVSEGLSATRRKAASIVVPSITLAEMNIGRFEERIRQLRRFQGLLDAEKEMATTISQLETEVADLQTEVDRLTADIDYSDASKVMSSKMSEYLNALNADRPNAWRLEARLRWKIQRNTFGVTIGDNKWSTKVGGTLTLYFLLAYHYALFSLSNSPRYHYPGIAILDLPAKLDDGTVIRDQENFILAPFIQLLNESTYSNCQLIIAGAAFENLENVNRISLHEVWT